MPVFSYKGMDASGKKVAGLVDAENIKAARSKLRRSSIFPTEVLEGARGSQRLSTRSFDLDKYLQRVTLADSAMMTRQLSTLINAHVPLVEALSALVEQIENPVLKSHLSEIRERVREGSRLADALKPYPKVFGELYINMVHAGETSGALDTVLVRLADFMEDQARLRSKVKGAMTYPVIMAGVGVLLIGFLLAAIVPKIVKVFENAKMVLPLPTRILISLSGFIKSYWYVLLLIAVGAAFGIKKFGATPRGRQLFDRYRLRMPIFGAIVRMVAVSRFCRTLSTLMHAGVQLMPSLDIVKGVVSNVVVSKVIEETRTSVKEGESIAEPLRRSGQFPPLVTHMIAIGEKTGELEGMLEKVAEAYDEQVDTKVSTLTTLLAPLMIVVMGAMVAFIVLAILWPLMNMTQLAK